MEHNPRLLDANDAMGYLHGRLRTRHPSNPRHERTLPIYGLQAVASAQVSR